jgi:hypothetical protein
MGNRRDYLRKHLPIMDLIFSWNSVVRLWYSIQPGNQLSELRGFGKKKATAIPACQPICAHMHVLQRNICKSKNKLSESSAFKTAFPGQR